MKDPVARLRKKSRLIAELRYKVAPEFLDRRGSIIADLHPKIEDPFEHWRSNRSRIVFLDSLEKPLCEFALDAKKLAVILEDFGNVSAFLDRSEKYLRLALDHMGPWIDELERVGVRFIEIFEVPGETRSQKIRELVASKFHKLPELPLSYSDSLIRMVHEQGYYQVGPTKRDEDWVRQIFKAPDENVPVAGIGFDIDSFAKDVSVAGPDDAVAAVRQVAALTKSIEEELVGYLGLLDG